MLVQLCCTSLYSSVLPDGGKRAIWPNFVCYYSCGAPVWPVVYLPVGGMRAIWLNREALGLIGMFHTSVSDGFGVAGT